MALTLYFHGIEMFLKNVFYIYCHHFLLQPHPAIHHTQESKELKVVF